LIAVETAKNKAAAVQCRLSLRECEQAGETNPDAMVRVRVGRLMLRMRQGNIEAVAVKLDKLSMTKPARSRKLGQRVYPAFYRDMSTFQYVSRWLQANDTSRVAAAVEMKDKLAYFQPLNTWPCGLYEGGKRTFDVVEDVEGCTECAETEGMLDWS
jgi:hypothetical protein